MKHCKRKHVSKTHAAPGSKNSNLGPKGHPKRYKTRKRIAVKPLDHELDISWLQNQLVLSQPRHLTGAEDFKWSYLHNALLSKLPVDLYSSEYRSKAAIAKMLQSEDCCKAFNINGPRNGFTYSAERLNTITFICQQIICDILGEREYDIFKYSRFSGGASTSRRKRHGDPYFKYTCMKGKPVHVTRSAYPYALALIKGTPNWHVSADDLIIVPGNRVTTVPKKTEIDRTIALEPDMNMSLQLAVGGHIRRCLKKIGINLNDQRNNQRLAYEGSVSGDLATIDLSAASDSISVNLVKLLLPHDWFMLMSDLRSETGLLPDGSTIVWEKFSSMGNGYTFELETLLFYAITKAVIMYEGRASALKATDLRRFVDRNHLVVYGDDIICPSTYSTSVISVLSEFGFKTNEEKTFITGPFRESCGKHYYNGYDVTPFYVKSVIDHPSRVVWLLNALRMWSYDDILEVCDPSTWLLWRKILKRYAPTALRGGKDIESQESICMPGPRRMQLTRLNRKIPISGFPALLRWFQNNNKFCDPALIMYASLDDTRDLSAYDTQIRYTQPGVPSIHVMSPVLFRLKRNNSQWCEIPMYPEEYT